MSYGPIPSQLTLEQVKAATTELERLAESELRATGVPGIAIAVAFKDQVVFAKGFGVREVGEASPVDADTMLQLASLSKPDRPTRADLKSLNSKRKKSYAKEVLKESQKPTQPRASPTGKSEPRCRCIVASLTEFP